MLEWRFTALQFVMLWEAYGPDRLPYPLRYQAFAEDFAELRRERAAALAVLLAQGYAPDLLRTLEILRNPDVRVEMAGRELAARGEDYRFHAAMREQVAATLRQYPGDGAVVLTQCQASQVPARAVAPLPPAAAGTGPPLEVWRTSLDSVPDWWDWDGPREQVNRIFARPREALGEVGVFAGAAVDARASPGRGFWWMDCPDGRYYVRTGDPITARPLSSPAMIREIARLVASTAGLRGRGETVR